MTRTVFAGRCPCERHISDKLCRWRTQEEEKHGSQERWSGQGGAVVPAGWHRPSCRPLSKMTNFFFISKLALVLLKVRAPFAAAHGSTPRNAAILLSCAYVTISMDSHRLVRREPGYELHHFPKTTSLLIRTSSLSPTSLPQVPFRRPSVTNIRLDSRTRLANGPPPLEMGR